MIYLGLNTGEDFWVFMGLFVSLYFHTEYVSAYKKQIPR